MKSQDERLAEQFEQTRRHLHAVAYRVLSSAAEEDNAVQETWLRLNSVDASRVENLRAWLTTVVGRVALDMLRARQTRREEALEASSAFAGQGVASRTDLERESLLADSVGLALLVVLNRLSPSERIAFVLHDMFDLPFDDVAAVVGCKPPAARQLASRARRLVRGHEDGAPAPADLARRREIAAAFLAASGAGDFEGLLSILDPKVVKRADTFAAPPAGHEMTGAERVAKAAKAYSSRGQFARLALVDGEVGIVVAPQGRLALVLALTIGGDKITGIDVIADPLRLAELDIRVLD